ncbi:OmpA family protein [Mesorhizobium kowhaii]|uniref:Flagellar motor protein MotB n=1 Tax=Mesorhizobium kowhaii TaxID=1300272 RepID=A0A2W7C042_9HYPH|nr:OmpA family protein [Mesorhizobium kowhaii]PZV36267.1 flagellar motor protein MotB [Mesorhizobium kowhaii]
MTRRPKILACTALGLLIASAPFGAPLSSAAFGAARFVASEPPIFIKLKCKEGESAEACALRQQAPSESAAPLPATEPQPTPKPKEAAPASEAAPIPEPTPPVEPSAKEQPAQPAAPASEAAPAQPAPDKSAPVEQAQPTADQAPLPTPVPQAPTQPAQGEQPAETKPEKKPAAEQPAAEEPAPKQPVTGEQPSTDQQPATSEKPANGEPAAPVQSEKPVQGEAPADPNAAPVLDSEKDAIRPGKDGKPPAQQSDGGQAAAPAAAPVDAGPPPADDKAAQQEIKPEKIVPVTEEKGTRRDKAPDSQPPERPKGADVLTEIGGRVIIQFNNQTIVESNDAPRMNRGAKDVYSEDLPGGRTRETIVRDNGNQIVTIRNRYGDVIQRSRITPDGREYVLSYVDERYYQDVQDWRDPGDDLPPMRLNIPRKQYILESDLVEDAGDYYTFLEQPPVEKVQRLYSVDEVKRSARVRDIARRVDLDTLNFESGSAAISDSEVKKLQGVADAMERLLKKNPAETFLIEGHTDAVGSDNANLALSDQRAEAVAEALTNAFGIAPENLTTQGYGERYLKVNTTGPERQNRRVAIRRITPLVAPVASAN